MSSAKKHGFVKSAQNNKAYDENFATKVGAMEKLSTGIRKKWLTRWFAYSAADRSLRYWQSRPAPGAVSKGVVDLATLAEILIVGNRVIHLCEVIHKNKDHLYISSCFSQSTKEMLTYLSPTFSRQHTYRDRAR